MIAKGCAHTFEDNINTDDIIAAKYLDSTDPEFLGKHCMENFRKGFVATVKPGDIIVAGKNFGCGSSREHAPVALKGCKISCVIAESFARIFYRNAINTGLPILVCGQACRIKEGDLLEVDVSSGIIKDITAGAEYASDTFPPFMQEIVDRGGLMNWVRSLKKQEEKPCLSRKLKFVS